MEFKTKLIKAIIHKRYKRFLSDIELPDGTLVVAHVPNTGSMTTCWEPGQEAWLTPNNNPKRKLKYTLEMTNNGETLISVNTSMTNKLVKEALENKVIKELSDYSTIIPEQKIYDSRIDFLLQQEGLKDTYVEVKNVTLKGDGEIVLFPDSVTTRGQKHLKDLLKIKESGLGAAMLYIVNREDVSVFKPADHIDPEYGKLLREADKGGVEILAYQSSLTPESISVVRKIKVEL